MKVENLTVEYQKASLGLDKHAPRISWKLQDNRRNWRDDCSTLARLERRLSGD